MDLTIIKLENKSMHLDTLYTHYRAIINLSFTVPAMLALVHSNNSICDQSVFPQLPAEPTQNGFA